MPKVYRAMKSADAKSPNVDATGKGLGVRGVPVNGVKDVDLDADGNVKLNGKGMSVAPAWRDLPFFLISRRLRDKFRDASGPKDLYCFTMGEGPFGDGPFASGLDLMQDKPNHANVVPDGIVSLERFQSDLANTRESWRIDED